MTNEELKKILENHKHWLNEDAPGWQEMRANLEGANLASADLTDAKLTEANLEGANLEGADLEGADLVRANLRCANLASADLTDAKLTEANLEGANLKEAVLTEAGLEDVCLKGGYLVSACLRNAYLVGANLKNVDFRGADLEGADLRGTYLKGADLRSAKNVPFVPMACPNEGSFIGWKKAMRINGDLCVIKLLIPEDAERSSATGRKCRCNKAKVMSIEDLKTGEPVDVAASKYDKRFIYKVGEFVEVENFDMNRFNECAPGVHFFINKQEAIDY